jgi:hypothetical protein
MASSKQRRYELRRELTHFIPHYLSAGPILHQPGNILVSCRPQFVLGTKDKLGDSQVVGNVCPKRNGRLENWHLARELVGTERAGQPRGDARVTANWPNSIHLLLRLPQSAVLVEIKLLLCSRNTLCGA